ncbi:sigma-70 family RNA polymerase sigma factor [Leucobacter viscericola]|uniref:Sigma-70 family RNA polymerase sigma factor n=1 Tax=Leucobacter viscericola TaxID=2714935 RepID=A0A6G7XFS3_9MICO|nr:sigma-70 family RNA polymerase sigma factor [Leucobacter viscericola]QIK63228.1 sigma-70 family RNA polymerase sigma factor [Leucobacter viscericola]
MPNTQSDAPLMSDEEILKRARNGDREAHSLLWSRHSKAGLYAARSFSSTFDPEDLVAEAYARIYRAMQTGSGPTTHFRPYLVTTIKNVARRWSQNKRDSTTENFEELLESETIEDFADSSIDKTVLLQAFKSLPERWQQVLWEVEVEDREPRELYKTLGLSPNSAAALTYRAREGLKLAWIDAHLDLHPPAPRCKNVVKQLAAFERGTLSAKTRAKVEAHLETCVSCRGAQTEAHFVAGHLKSALLVTIFAGGFAVPATFSALSLVAPSAAHATGGGLAQGMAASLESGKAALQQVLGFSPKIAVGLVTATALVSGGAILASNFPTTTSGPNAEEVTAGSQGSAAKTDTDPETNSGTGQLVGSSTNNRDASTTPDAGATQTSESEADSMLAAPSFNLPHGNILNGADAVISGTALPGALVTLYISGDKTPHAVETVRVNEAGGWAHALSNPQEGALVARAYQSSATGQRSPLSTSQYSVTWNAPASAPVIDSVDTADGTLAPVVSGTGEPGNIVELTLNSVTTTKRVDSEGKWTAQINGGLLLGQNALTATQRPSQSRQQSASTKPQQFELKAPSASISLEPEDHIDVVLTSTPDHHVLITGEAERFAHTVSPTTGLDSIRLFSERLVASATTSKGLTLRYISEDGERSGVGVTEKISV